MRELPAGPLIEAMIIDTSCTTMRTHDFVLPSRRARLSTVSEGLRDNAAVSRATALGAAGRFGGSVTYSQRGRVLASTGPLYEQGTHLLEAMWQFEPEALSLNAYATYWLKHRYLEKAPASQILKPIENQSRWLVYFLFIPDGQLHDHHRFTLERLKAHGDKLLIVCSAQHHDTIPSELHAAADALIWKALSGYDFSAYALALHAVAEYSEGADVFIMNDSVFGPFSDISSLFATTPWDLTGFTASDACAQRHIQSYAFIMRDVTPQRLSPMSWIFRKHTAFSNPIAVVGCQELWMARVAAKSMTVGSLWFGRDEVVHDPSLTQGIALLETGFPFLKRSLMSKHGKFQHTSEVLAALRRMGHPEPTF